MKSLKSKVLTALLGGIGVIFIVVIEPVKNFV